MKVDVKGEEKEIVAIFRVLKAECNPLSLFKSKELRSELESLTNIPS